MELETFSALLAAIVRSSEESEREARSGLCEVLVAVGERSPVLDLRAVVFRGGLMVDASMASGQPYPPVSAPALVRGHDFVVALAPWTAEDGSPPGSSAFVLAASYSAEELGIPPFLEVPAIIALFDYSDDIGDSSRLWWGTFSNVRYDGQSSTAEIQQMGAALFGADGKRRPLDAGDAAFREDLVTRLVRSVFEVNHSVPAGSPEPPVQHPPAQKRSRFAAAFRWLSGSGG